MDRNLHTSYSESGMQERERRMNSYYLEKAKDMLKQYIDIKQDDWSLFDLSAMKESVKLLIGGQIFTKRQLQQIAFKEHGILIPNTFFE